ncbi:MAG: CAP family protein [Kofleriaceae bacterium]
MRLHLAWLTALAACSAAPARGPAPAGPRATATPAAADQADDDGWMTDDEPGTATVATQARPPAPPRPASTLDPAAQAMLDAHNQARAEHCAPPLTWSPALATEAQAWADHLASDGCAFEHSATPHGENLAAGSPSIMGPAQAVAMWVDERAQYDFTRGGFSMRTGHFTQVVWRATAAVGCGRSVCNGMNLWVCNYDPPGNVMDDYRRNVVDRGCR